MLTQIILLIIQQSASNVGGDDSSTVCMEPGHDSTMTVDVVAALRTIKWMGLSDVTAIHFKSVYRPPTMYK